MDELDKQAREVTSDEVTRRRRAMEAQFVLESAIDEARAKRAPEFRDEKTGESVNFYDFVL